MQGTKGAQAAAFQAFVVPTHGTGIGWRLLPYWEVSSQVSRRQLMTPWSLHAREWQKVATLIVNDSKLIGVLAFKDVISRVPQVFSFWHRQYLNTIASLSALLTLWVWITAVDLTTILILMMLPLEHSACLQRGERHHLDNDSLASRVVDRPQAVRNCLIRLALGFVESSQRKRVEVFNPQTSPVRWQ